MPLGSYAVNRLNGERVPIYTGDYVLMGYGSGAVMGVPAHDSRDFAFAKKYGLPVRIVIAPITWDGSDLTEAYLDDGFMTNSGKYEGMTDEEGKQAIADDIEKNGWGRRTVSYRVRDWIISRQRYWGTPIPIVYCAQCGIVPVPEDALPVLLPPRRGVQTNRGITIGRQRGLRERRLSSMQRTRPPRDRHYGHLLRLVVVHAAVLGSELR